MADLDPVVGRLRAVFEPYRPRLAATQDGPARFTLEIPGREGRPDGFFGGVRLGKRYVSFYLMPAYAFPDLLEGISPQLRRRMQGKSCFNFTAVDESLIAELESLTAACFERYRSERLV